MLSLVTGVVGDTSEDSDWLVGDMLLQDRVLVSPDITHTDSARRVTLTGYRHTLLSHLHTHISLLLPALSYAHRHVKHTHGGTRGGWRHTGGGHNNYYIVDQAGFEEYLYLSMPSVLTSPAEAPRPSTTNVLKTEDR